MKYRVITTKCLFGEILVTAKNKDEAQKRAYEIAQNDEYAWHDKEKIDIHEIHEIPIFCKNCNTKISPDSIFCNKCGTKISEEIDLGRIYSVPFDKTCQTTYLFDKFHGFSNGKCYDTIMLKNVCYIWKTLPDNIYKDISASISFYIRNDPLKYTLDIFNTNMTISEIKKHYCGRALSAKLDNNSLIYCLFIILLLLLDIFSIFILLLVNT